MTVPYRPSNGTEGDIFMSRFCHRCARDVEFRDDPEEGVSCPILLAAFAYYTSDPHYPKEWVRDEDAERGLIGGKGARCTAFVEEGQEIPYRCDKTKDIFDDHS
jgi:hypothetical protein